MSPLTRTFMAEEISTCVEVFGEEKVLELTVFIEDLGKSRLTEILQKEYW